MKRLCYLALAVILLSALAIVSIRMLTPDRIRDEAYARLSSSISDNGYNAEIKPLTYAGRSEWVPFGVDAEWESLTVSGEEVYLYYWPGIGKEMATAAQSTEGLKKCVVTEDFVFYDRDSAVIINELLQALNAID